MFQTQNFSVGGELAMLLAMLCFDLNGVWEANTSSPCRHDEVIVRWLLSRLGSASAGNELRWPTGTGGRSLRAELVKRNLSPLRLRHAHRYVNQTEAISWPGRLHQHDRRGRAEDRASPLSIESEACGQLLTVANQKAKYPVSDQIQISGTEDVRASIAPTLKANCEISCASHGSLDPNCLN